MIEKNRGGVGGVGQGLFTQCVKNIWIWQRMASLRSTHGKLLFALPLKTSLFAEIAWSDAFFCFIHYEGSSLYSISSIKKYY